MLIPDVNSVATESAQALVRTSFGNQCNQLKDAAIEVPIHRGALGDGVDDPTAPVFQIPLKAMAGRVGITQKKVTIQLEALHSGLFGFASCKPLSKDRVAKECNLHLKVSILYKAVIYE